MPQSDLSAFEEMRQRAIEKIAAQIDAVLAIPDGPERRLVEAMRYSALGDGKGFRAALCLATAALFDVDEAQAVRVAAAIECVHCYSLAHDDLPSMDDDDMRRGRPSLHKAYDEATAILAGDALLTLAFEILSDAATHADATIRLQLIGRLAHAAGMNAMIGGQMIDLLSPDLELDAEGLTRLQKMKTGAMISYAVEAGALLGKANTAQHQALLQYADAVGLAFQISDDVLDTEGASAALGKTAGKDADTGKVTFASLLGVSQAREKAHALVATAIGHLDIFDTEAEILRQAATFVVHRKN